MSSLVIAPHPDDETLGAGGTLLSEKKAGQEIHWLIVTKMDKRFGFSVEAIDRRRREINTIDQAFGFRSKTELGFPPSQLDTIPLSELINSISRVIKKIQPTTIYAPFGGDAHSDHRATSAAITACTKSFRYPSVKRIIAMEIPSETDQVIDPTINCFKPNLFVDISDFLEEKIRIMNFYDSEMGPPPFPRSERVIRSLAHWRGSQANLNAAEAFQVLKEIR